MKEQMNEGKKRKEYTKYIDVSRAEQVYANILHLNLRIIVKMDAKNQRILW